MAGYTDYYDIRRQRPRSRQKNGRTAENDIIATVITIQVIMCIILIIAFVVYKKADAARYGDFKEEYASLVRDDKRNGEVVDMFSTAADSISGAINSFEMYLARMLEGLGSGKTDEPSASLPDENLQIVPEQETEKQTDARSYDYLQEVSSAQGAGGWFPAEWPDNDEAIEAPDGSTLAPLVVSAKMKPPVTGIITSSFGYRHHPVTGAEDFHTGMDIASVEGTSVLAALPGLVSETGESQIYGKYIKIRHTDSLETFYAHCSEIIAEEGMLVRRGDRIAKVGNTGVTTGPHLHFSVIVDGLNTNPYWVLRDNIKILEE